MTDEQLSRFAKSSGDRNPLHIDERFARRTPYGRRIAHGALVAMAALGSANEEALLHATALEMQFINTPTGWRIASVRPLKS